MCKSIFGYLPLTFHENGYVSELIFNWRDSAGEYMLMKTLMPSLITWTIQPYESFSTLVHTQADTISDRFV